MLINATSISYNYIELALKYKQSTNSLFYMTPNTNFFFVFQVKNCFTLA